jgi:hypothetical protein
MAEVGRIGALIRRLSIESPSFNMFFLAGEVAWCMDMGIRWIGLVVGGWQLVVRISVLGDACFGPHGCCVV